MVFELEELNEFDVNDAKFVFEENAVLAVVVVAAELAFDENNELATAVCNSVCFNLSNLLIKKVDAI
jgi:hypothetical protein